MESPEGAPAQASSARMCSKHCMRHPRPRPQLLRAVADSAGRSTPHRGEVGQAVAQQQATAHLAAVPDRGPAGNVRGMASDAFSVKRNPVTWSVPHFQTL